MYIKYIPNNNCRIILQRNGYKFDFLFSELRHFKIIDKNSIVFGTSNDALLSLKDFSIDSLILHKENFGKQLKESNYKQIGKFFIPMSTIERIDSSNKTIMLNESMDSIKYINLNFTTHEETIQYLKLKEIPIYSRSDEKIGKIVDIYYPSEDSCKFIVTTSELREFFEKLHLVQNHDLVVSEHLIIHLSESKIQVNVEKDDLVTAIAQSLKNPAEKIQKDFMTINSADDIKTIFNSRFH